MSWLVDTGNSSRPRETSVKSGTTLRSQVRPRSQRLYYPERTGVSIDAPQVVQVTTRVGPFGDGPRPVAWEAAAGGGVTILGSPLYVPS